MLPAAERASTCNLLHKPLAICCTKLDHKKERLLERAWTFSLPCHSCFRVGGHLTITICCHKHIRLSLCYTDTQSLPILQDSPVTTYLRKVSRLLFSTKALNSTESLQEHGRSGPLPASCKCRTNTQPYIMRVNSRSSLKVRGHTTSQA